MPKQADGVQQQHLPGPSLQRVVLLLSLCCVKRHTAFILHGSPFGRSTSQWTAQNGHQSTVLEISHHDGHHGLIYHGFWTRALEMMRDAWPTMDPISLPSTLAFKEGMMKTPQKGQPSRVTIELHAFRVDGRVRQARAAVLRANRPSPQVLNFVIFPDPSLDVPIFGADLVKLPGGHLILLDLQPCTPTDTEAEAESQPYYTELKHVYERYRGLLPDGGELPDAARRFFSPWCLYTRVNDDAAVETLVFDAFVDYLRVYLEALKTATVVVDDAKRRQIEEGHRAYSQYRAVNDPARGMLTRLYGEEYTEKVIHEVLFDMATKT